MSIHLNREDESLSIEIVDMETIVEYVCPSTIATPYINFLELNGKKIKT